MPENNVRDAHMQLTAGGLTALLGGELRGDDRAVTGLKSLQHAGSSDISFLSNPKLREEARTSQAGVLIVSEKSAGTLSCRTLIVTADPYLYFARVAAIFHPPRVPVPGIHPTASVALSAVVSPDCEIGAQAVVGERSVIGPATILEAGAVVGNDCVIGSGCRLYANATVYHGCRIGDRVELHAGSVIGADGFGLAWDKEHNSWFRIVQTGAVVLGDDVEIGANSTVDRGALEDTVIGRGTKIDNQVQIGHNCRIGAHVAVAGCAGIAGSTTIGDYAVIGGAAMIGGHLNIPAKTTVGAATSVSHSIKEPGFYASMYPLQTHKEWVRNAPYVRHIRDMEHRIRQLEQQLSAVAETGGSLTASQE